MMRILILVLALLLAGPVLAWGYDDWSESDDYEEGIEPPPLGFRINPDGSATPMVEVMPGLYVNPQTGNPMPSPMPGVVVDPNTGYPFPIMEPPAY